MRDESVIEGVEQEPIERDESSMQVLEYSLAFVAVVAAVLLMIVR